MTCRQFTGFLTDYLSGDVPDPARRLFEHHLGICGACQRYVTHYRDAIACGRTAFADLDAAVPDSVPEDLIAAILAARHAG